MQSHRPSNL